MGGHNNVLEDSYGNSSQDSTMMMREVIRPNSFTGFIQTFLNFWDFKFSILKHVRLEERRNKCKNLQSTQKTIN